MQGLNLINSNSLLTHGFDDHFHGGLNGWTSLGTAAYQDAAGGVVKHTTGTTANNEAGPHRTKKEFLPAASKPMQFLGRVKFTDASGATGAVAVGVSSAIGAGLIANGGLSVASGDQTSFLFVKLTGETNWRCYTKVGALTALNDILTVANKNNVSQAAQGPDGEFQNLQIDVNVNATDAMVTYSIDKVTVCQHRISLATAVVAGVAVFVKTTNTTAQDIYTDLVVAQQKL